jgi:hypothetical protein
LLWLLREEFFFPGFICAELKLRILLKHALTRSSEITYCHFYFILVSNNVTVIPQHFCMSLSYFTFAITTGAENNAYFHG